MTNITDSFKKFAQQFPEKTAVQIHSQSLSYLEWYTLAAKTANWLNSFSVSNKSVGFLLSNGIPFLQLFAGASMAGWIAIPFDVKWKAEELESRLALSAPSVFVTTKELYSLVAQFHTHVLIWDDCLPEIMKMSSVDDFQTEETLPFYMGFTSGTTGNPKAFIRSHHSWTASYLVNKLDFKMDENEHVLIPGALIHSHFLYGAISTLSIGGTVYLLEKFNAVQTLSSVKTHPITALYVVPTMVEAILKEDQMIEKTMKFISSGAKWDEHSKHKIRKQFMNLNMIEFYGASELSYVAFLTNEHNGDSVGKPCHGVEIEIRDSSNNKCKSYEIGKIYVRSGMIFTGYLHPETGTIQSIQDEDGWATVDDMGFLDENGFLYISGREKSIILYGAINIFPEEIEKVISRHPAVEEVAVVGLYDPYWGQVAAAAVKGNASRLDLKRFCKRHLSAYKIPRKWVFLDEMPYTTSGKIARAQLRDFLESKVKNH